ncbi:MAG TPA: hypothetical protein VGB04_03815 [Allosphingosinicella sp.]|jgi:hypothetical protein
MKLSPKFGLAAAAILLAGAGGAAFAHPHPGGDGEKVRNFVVIHQGKEGESLSGRAGDPFRALAIHRAGGAVACNGGDKIVDEVTGDDGNQTKVIICSQGTPTGADAERLEKALARIAEMDQLNDEQKARIETALRSAIDRARSAR